MSVFNLLDAKLAVRAARNYHVLRSQGITIRKTVRKTADTIIATFCIENDLPLLHSDRNFKHFQDRLGLKVSI